MSDAVMPWWAEVRTHCSVSVVEVGSEDEGHEVARLAASHGYDARTFQALPGQALGLVRPALPGPHCRDCLGSGECPCERPAGAPAHDCQTCDGTGTLAAWRVA